MEDRSHHDWDLVQAALRGSGDAFAALVRRHQRLVAGVAWRYGTPREDVEDVVSEVFFKVYRNLNRYRPEHPFSTWLYRLAANHVMDRARRARKERGRTEMPAAVPDRSPGAGERLQRKERAELLRAALRDLPARFREAIFLVHVEGNRVEDAARMLGVPVGTVKTRLMRGRQALRKRLARLHPEYFGA